MKKTVLLSFIIVAGLKSIEVKAQSGSLDLSFGDKGRVVTSFGNYAVANAVLTTTNNEILAGGTGFDSSGKFQGFTVVKYFNNGIIDSSFGFQGKAFSAVPVNIGMDGNAMALLSNGKILMGGDFKFSTPYYALTRFLLNGKIDSSFGTNGIFNGLFYNLEGYIKSIALLPNGSFIAASISPDVLPTITLIKFDSSGKIDSTFGINGLASTNNSVAAPLKIAITNDGSIIISTNDDESMAVIKFTKDGVLDNNFGNNGYVELYRDLVSGGSCLSILPDQNILIGGFIRNDSGTVSFAVVRIDDKGNVDNTFGANNGYTLSNFPGESYCYDMAVENNGKILLSGFTFTSLGYDFAICRFDSSGIIDSSFGLNGQTNTDFYEQNDESFAMAIQDQDKVILCGSTTPFLGGYSSYALARYTLVSNDSIILPVTLLYFTAQKQNNSTLLQWQTANEVNNSYFSIERSANGGLFTGIGQQAALKTSAVNNYAFTDNAPLQGNNYYRLKQVDKDGKFTYSNIVTVEFATGLLFTVSPNPATDFINIVSAGTVANAAITITDMNGRTLYTGKQNFVAHQPVKIPASQFANQVLMVTVNAANSRQVFKVVKE